MKKEQIRDMIEKSEIGELLYSDFALGAFDLIDKLAEKIYNELDKK